MEDYTRRRFNCVERVHFYAGKPELAPLTPKETTLFAGVTAAWNGMKTWNVDQGMGNRGFREGCAERRRLISSMSSMNRRISDLAKSIALEGVNPGLAERFRLPRNRTYDVVIATAQGFAAEADSVEALFIERGMPATFIADLEALIPQFQTAGGTRVDGLATQTAGTAGLELLARQGLKFVRLLRPIIREKLQSQPALQAAWNLASRVAARGAAEPAGTPPTPPPESSGSGI
jgi:hypothetical protein